MANPRRNLEREAVICGLYQQGKTLQEVGDVFGLTRERVRQILRRAGVGRAAGGVQLRAKKAQMDRLTRRRIELDARAQAIFGCYYDEMRSLNGGLQQSANGSPAQRYLSQKRNADKRGIEWSISFPEWMAVWEESGHFDERGRSSQGYCMARYRDIGPYEIGNVYITSCGDNVSDYQSELKRRGVVCADGIKRLPERAALMQEEESSRE